MREGILRWGLDADEGLADTVEGDGVAVKEADATQTDA